VKIGDIAVMECTDTSVINRLKTEKLIEVDANPNHQTVVSVLYVIQKIHAIYPELQVQNLGEGREGSKENSQDALRE
jgi:stage V sporulation protein AA